MKPDWYSIDDIDTIDSPALLVYLPRVLENIRFAKAMVKNVDALRPHVKTNKMTEACLLMMQEGITKFKCATIAEAEMLGMIEAPDVLLAYQPVGPKLERFISLMVAYPHTRFSCLVDNHSSADLINSAAALHDITIDIFIDINVGMNRTGIIPPAVMKLAGHIRNLSNLGLSGLHAYDGHINESDLLLRQQMADEVYEQVNQLVLQAASKFDVSLKIVIGGSPCFPMHATRDNVECSPGTFIFWDWGYKMAFPDQLFQYAALVITRVISIIDDHFLCTDLGYKSIACEKPQPRVYFLNAPDAVAFGHSEEHLVLQVPDAAAFKIGDVLYGVPLHICPTVALYDDANVVEDKRIIASWKIVAGSRRIVH
ncbi:MAG: D-TA family PLP-dependent enzyme [Bacteroidota bacterium]